MTIKRFGKKLLRFTGIFLGVIVILFTAFHFWFISHAKSLLEDTVSQRSNGKLKLKIEHLSYNYFNRRMIIKDAVFMNTDTATSTTANRFAVKEIRLQLKALLPLIFNKKLLIDSLYLQSPDIQVTKLKFTIDTLKKKGDDISIPYEMGKIYKSIQDALHLLHVGRFQIDDGKFTLINKVQPDQLPLTVSNIHFHIDNFNVDEGKLKDNEKILFSDNIDLRSNDQNIIFPDGRHRLSFNRFRINLKNKLVEFDSCTIEATRTDSSETSFKVFFDALLLTNIDFDLLYKSEIIKADSVYCVNPKFILNVEIAKKKNAGKAPPKLENLIKQLTGDLQLNYVVVENADFNIRTIKDGNPTTFTFNRNNFEMQGLTIDQEAEKPLKLKSFAMAIRNYENFIKDSSYSVKFDSIVIKDSKITLSNFVFNKLDNGRILNTFSIPRFVLEGLSLDALVLDQKLKARQATLFYPQISYTASNKKRAGGKQNIFQSLGTVNEYMDLDRLEVIDGNIDLKLDKNVQVLLDNATFSIQSHSLLESKKISGIKNSLTSLDFSRGQIHAGNVVMDLHNIRYIGQDGAFKAGGINVTDKNKKLAIVMQNVSVGKLKVDEATGDIFAEGIKWQTANVNFSSIKNGAPGSSPVINISKIEGGNTVFSGNINGKIISTKLNSISLDRLVKEPGNKLVLEGLKANGQQLQVKDTNFALSTGAYQLIDNNNSSFRQLTYRSSGKTNTDIAIPLLTVTPHIQPLLNGDIMLDDVVLSKPIISLHIPKADSSVVAKKPVLPGIVINSIKLLQPDISFIKDYDSGTLNLTWHGEKHAANFLLATGLRNNSGDGINTTINNLRFYLADLAFADPKGKTFNTGDGRTAAQLRDISLNQTGSDPLHWKATISNFDAKDFRLDSLERSGGSFVMNSITLKELDINSATIKDPQQLAAANTLFQLTNFTGHYTTAASAISWYNTGYDRKTRILSLDSFSFNPTMERDSFIATQKFQTDYIRASTGSVRIGPVDINKFIKDSVLDVQKIEIEKAAFFDYKDKSLPFNSGLIKPLPVDMIKKIPFKISVDSVLVNNSFVEYTEVNEKSKMVGTIPVTRMTVALINVKNYNITDTDSLLIKANGYIMDTVWTRLRVRQSYTDSLGGFMMTVRLKPGDLTVLNSALIPLASIKLLSGTLDTLSMRAVGREYLAMGEMKMYYKNLKLQLLKNGVATKKTIFTRLLTFVVNSFVIRKNNSSRTGDVFFIRQRDRSAINYLIKIALSGMASSVGAKNNKKLIRRYQKQLQRRNLPPITWEE